ISFSTISKNSTSGDDSLNYLDFGEGSGIFNAGDLTLGYSSVVENGAVVFGAAYGGGIYNKGSLRVGDSTISFNKVLSCTYQRSGGGGYSTSGKRWSNNCTIASNIGGISCGSAGGGVWGDITAMRNTIIAGNSAKGGPDLSGTILSSGHNLIGDSSGGAGYDPTDLLNVDPLLGP